MVLSKQVGVFMSGAKEQESPAQCAPYSL